MARQGGLSSSTSTFHLGDFLRLNLREDQPSRILREPSLLRTALRVRRLRQVFHLVLATARTVSEPVIRALSPRPLPSHHFAEVVDARVQLGKTYRLLWEAAHR